MAVAEQPRTVALASRKRRFVGYILDTVPAAVSFAPALIVYSPRGAFSGDNVVGVTALSTGMLILGGILWFRLTTGRGQSPAKWLLRLRVIRTDGLVADWRWMFAREIALKSVSFSALGWALSATVGDAIGAWIVSLALAVAALWCAWDANRQCLWDKAAGTLVVHDPDGVVAPGVPVIVDRGSVAVTPATPAGYLDTLADFHRRGLLSDAEYEERRQREMERL